MRQYRIRHLVVKLVRISSISHIHNCSKLVAKHKCGSYVLIPKNSKKFQKLRNLNKPLPTQRAMIRHFLFTILHERSRMLWARKGVFVKTDNVQNNI